MKDCAIYVAGSTNLSVSVELAAQNVRDDDYFSTVMVGFLPLNVVQANMPTATGVEGSTDAGTSYVRANIPTNGIAYITGQPAAPQLTAKFKGLPEWVEVTWGGSLTTERTERGTLDNRTLNAETLGGDEEYSITGALSNEIVGGNISLQVVVSGPEDLNYNFPFRIRGKNPLDLNARSYITALAPSGSGDYAWKIAKHESRQTSRFYNQYNAGGDTVGTPNKTNLHNGWGWGIAQIDKGEFGDNTAEVYDWHVNVCSMTNKLVKAQSDARRFIGYYRSAYSANGNWTEPPSTNINGVVVSAEMWSVLVLYNGVGGVPWQSAPTASARFRSPLQFVPGTGRWLFHSNTSNPDYVLDVVSHAQLLETE